MQAADLKHYKAVLVIPALYKRNLVKHFISLLLLKYVFILLIYLIWGLDKLLVQVRDRSCKN